jgi:hypothetical protein
LSFAVAEDDDAALAEAWASRIHCGKGDIFDESLLLLPFFRVARNTNRPARGG